MDSNKNRNCKALKTRSGTTTNCLYSGPDIVGEYGSTWGSPAALFTHGPNMDDPIIRSTSTATQYYHQDGLGSVVGVSNGSGSTDGTARYDAWGNVASSVGSIPQYGYTGREPDETGLVYYRARYYDPSIGRFVQRDPIGFAGGDINLYAYVANNPINFNDPTGEIIPAWVASGIYGGISGAVGGAITGYAGGGVSGLWKGALVGGAVGAVSGGALQPHLSYAAGSAAAARLTARLITGIITTSAGQLGGNVANREPLGTNFSGIVAFAGGLGNVAAAGPAAAVGSRVGSIAANLGATTPRAAGILGEVVTSFAEGAIGAGAELSGTVVDSLGLISPNVSHVSLSPTVIPGDLSFRNAPPTSGTQSLPAFVDPNTSSDETSYTGSGFDPTRFCLITCLQGRDK